MADIPDIAGQLKRLSEMRLGVDPFSIRAPVLPTHVTNPAKWVFERLVESIKQFEANLDSEHEIGARLVSFGSFEFHIQDMGYEGPHMIKFYGADLQGQPVQLIQHVTQLNVLLMALKKRGDTATRIGFVLEQKSPEKKDSNT